MGEEVKEGSLLLTSPLSSSSLAASWRSVTGQIDEIATGGRGPSPLSPFFTWVFRGVVEREGSKTTTD